MQRNEPLAKAGLIKFDASIVLPILEPAPIIMWISSINKTASGFFFNAFKSCFKRFSKSPRYLVPATKAPMSKLYTSAFANGFGALPLTMSQAKPSAIDVLPTPGSPTNNGLFLRRRHRICAARSISFSRPIKGSVLPFCASTFKLVVYSSKGPALLELVDSPSRSSISSSTCTSSLRVPWAKYCVRVKRLI